MYAAGELVSSDEQALASQGITGLEVLGRGGFATVYGAFDQKVGRAVAVKVLNRSATDTRALRQFDRECEAVARLADEPTIVPVFKAGLLPDGRPFLVMARVEGGSLQEHVQRNGPVPWPEVVALGTAVARALAAAHRGGVVHCDVKPANILLNPDVAHPQLADFGIATLATIDEATITQSSGGTPCYLPPEALDGERPEPSRDVYSLAATMQFAMTGLLPFAPTDGGMYALMQRIATEPPADLRVHGVPDAVAGVIERALAKQPDNRYRSADEFAQHLGLAATGRSVPKPPTARPRPTVRGIAAVAGTAAVVLSMVGGFLAFRERGNANSPSANSPGATASTTVGSSVTASGSTLAAAGSGAEIPTTTVPTTETSAVGSSVPTSGSVVSAVSTDTSLSAVTTLVPSVATTGAPGAASVGGSSALAARLAAPVGLALAADGAVFIADSANHSVRRVGPDGQITTVAGTGSAGRSGDGGAAVAAQLSQPMDVALAPDGSLYIADTGNHRIRRVATDGTISSVIGAGDGPGFTGDGSPGPRTQLNFPESVAVAGDGTVYVGEVGRIRRYVPSEGIVTTIGGDGSFATGGDGGPVGASQVGRVVGIDVLPDGSLVMVDGENGRVRRIADGIINAVAGTGACCGSGDGGPALAASFWFPRGVSVGADGSIYIAEAGTHVVRRIRPDGIVVAFAGSGNEAFGGDGTNALLADFKGVSGVAVGPDGRVYIADTGNNRVRVVTTDGVVQTFAGSGAA